MTNPDNKTLYINPLERGRIENLGPEQYVRQFFFPYRGLVWMDKDGTFIKPGTEETNASGLPEFVHEATTKRGLFVGIDSDSAGRELVAIGKRYNMNGPHIAEGGRVMVFPDSTEIHFVQSAPWFIEFTRRLIDKAYTDPQLRRNSTILLGDSWAILNQIPKLPAYASNAILFNTGRVTTSSFQTRTLDANNEWQRDTPENDALFTRMLEMAYKLKGEMEAEGLKLPKGEEFTDDKNSHPLKSTIFSTSGTNKRVLMSWLNHVLGPDKTIIHIGDGGADDMRNVPSITNMAVANAKFVDAPGVVAASSPITQGVLELFSQRIFPQFPPVTNV